jgi:hypothetical protein
MKFSLEKHWVETFALISLLVGFLIAVVVRETSLLYAFIFLAGFLAGRVFYFTHKRTFILPLILLVLGFLVGYFVGSIWTNRFVSLSIFIIGFLLSYYLHLNQILVSFKNKNFIK